MSTMNAETNDSLYTPAGGIIRRADPERLQESGYFNRNHDYDVPASVGLVDLLQRTYWLSVASRLHQFDEIKCKSLRMYVMLLVMDIGPESVRVERLFGTEFPSDIGIAPPGAARGHIQGGEVRFVYDGKVTKWQVWEYDVAQGAERLLKQRFETEAEARSWYATFKREQGRT